jgi:hypothetical protein
VTHHRVDSNGHPTCHDACADREANLEKTTARCAEARALRTTRKSENRIERLLITSSGQEGIRLSSWPEDNGQPPDGRAGSEFIELLAQGVTQGVLSSRFVFRLIEAIKTAGQSAARQCVNEHELSRRAGSAPPGDREAAAGGG